MDKINFAFEQLLHNFYQHLQKFKHETGRFFKELKLKKKSQFQLLAFYTKVFAPGLL